MARLLLMLVVLSFMSISLGTNLYREDRKSYSNYHVIQITPRTVEQQTALLVLQTDNELYYETEWRPLGKEWTMIVPPSEVDDVCEHLNKNDLDYSIVNNNIQRDLDEELLRLRSRYASTNLAFNLTDWNTYEDIMTEIDNMAARCHANVSCTVEVLGQSLEGRDIKVLRMSRAGSGRRAYWVDSIIHANEWLSPATMLVMFDHMTRNYGTDPDVTRLLDTYDWHYIPVHNPDGYVYAWEVDRNWRKNTSINPGSNCTGTDLNRNYDINWMSDGSSTDPCSNNFGGSSAASEPETQVITAEINRLAPTLEALLTVHIAAQMWIHPWGHTNATGCVYAEDHEELLRVVNAAADAVEATFGTVWERGNTCETIYPASGTTMDYGKAAGIKYTFTPELRGPGSNLTTEDIMPSFQETWNGILAMIDAIENKPAL